MMPMGVEAVRIDLAQYLGEAVHVDLCMDQPCEEVTIHGVLMGLCGLPLVRCVFPGEWRVAQLKAALSRRWDGWRGHGMSQCGVSVESRYGAGKSGGWERRDSVGWGQTSVGLSVGGTESVYGVEEPLRSLRVRILTSSRLFEFEGAGVGDMGREERVLMAERAVGEVTDWVGATIRYYRS